MPEPLTTFVDRRQDAWRELGQLVERARGRVERLDASDIHDLGRRYRSAAADLAQARRRWPHDRVTTELDALVRQARPLVYGTTTERMSVRWFATTGYWRRVRERPVFLLIAIAVLWLPAIAIGLWANAYPEEAARVARVSPMTAGIGEDAPRDPDTEKETDAGVNAALSSQIFTNNARVAFIAYAGGLTGGILTIIILAFNGMIVGLVGGLAVSLGYGDAFWRLVPPHGVLELSLIAVAGAAGLRTGWALVHPGHRTRADALAEDGRAGVEMAIGTAVLLVPLGFVEGFLSVRGLSLPMALGVGFGLGALYWGMVLWRGRPPGARVTAAPPP